MIGTCGVSPEVDNIERILEVCAELLIHIKRLESQVNNLQGDGRGTE